MESKKYQRLCFAERVIIETLLKQEKTYSYIAKQINRNRSTVSRELATWIKKPGDRYIAHIADFMARDNYLNKRNLDKISSHKPLKIFVYRGLLSKYSPEQIAGRIKLEHPNNPLMSISHEAIYTHIYHYNQGKLKRKLIDLLLYSKSKRRSRKASKAIKDRIKDALSIDNRPKHVDLRIEPGHWEGDLVIGIKQASAIATIVERKTRFVYIMKLKNRKSNTVTKAFKNALKKLDGHMKKSMTYDNGMEMANHKWLTKKTGMTIYFAHPYSSWERGTNENTNGLIRRYFPKNTDFNKVTEEQIRAVQNLLNNRPRKVLGFYTPAEKLKMEIEISTKGYSDDFYSPNGYKKIIGNNLS